MKKHIAKYQIDDTFRITGRGIVLTGIVKSGTITIGDFLKFDFNGKVLLRKIIGIEGLTPATENQNTGVLIDSENEKEVEQLYNWKPNKIVGLVFSQND